MRIRSTRRAARPSALCAVTETSYVPGDGPKNIFPVFTVANGLTCKMSIYTYGATCMATQDGGVACMGGGVAPQGFLVTSTNTTTFGGR
jgi:hypothetical protein